MKVNKFTSALVALGVVSLAGVAHATNPVIYVNGSTAARATFYNAAITAGQIFDSNNGGVGYPKAVSPSPGSGANQIVYEGYITNTVAHTETLVDIDCDWTGSEAGIASTAGQPLQQTLNNPALGLPNGSYALPGVPPTFYTQSSGWTTTAALSAIPGAPAVPDLAMADTSQAVSQTPKSLYNLVDYGVVGIIPFTFMKGYEKTPTAPWTDTVNITTAQINQLIGAPQPANFVTGVAADSSESVAIVGRNLGSGTRANALLNFQYGINTAVDQWAYNVSYTGAGVLTQNTATYSPVGGIVEVFNDGFDSGGNVAKELNIDGTGQGVVLVGYLGISDAAAASVATSGQIGLGGGNATYLPWNGVYESDSGVVNGTYSYWGQEHLLGTVGQSPTSQAGVAATAIVNGLLVNENASGIQTGNVLTHAQTAVLAKSLMQVKRSTDVGFPQVGTYH
jgi:hypothetical protein